MLSLPRLGCLLRTPAGPLLYHWQHKQGETDGRYDESVELTYYEVRHAISQKGFKFLKESTTSCTYAANKLSIMKTQYTCLFFTAQKLDGAAPAAGPGAASLATGAPSTTPR